MQLKNISLSNFRNHKNSIFSFDSKITFIVGKNTSGKTNLLESITYLSNGKSFKGTKDEDAATKGQNISRIKGKTEDTQLEILIHLESLEPLSVKKKYLVNGVARSRINFSSNLSSIIFSPTDLDVITGSPGLRRAFLDMVLEEADREYRYALTSYTKALRQRNALLDLAKENGIRNEKQFEYWDSVLIENGQFITQKREEFIDFVNSSQKDIFEFNIFYDKSTISSSRLEQYKDAELGAGVTLVGPHRDDFAVSMIDSGVNVDIKAFGSRGQQRLVILQLKLLQLDFIEKKLGERPIFLLDDIFSELDSAHIELVKEMIDKQQSIITTTHMEFVGKGFEKASVIELKKDENI